MSSKTQSAGNALLIFIFLFSALAGFGVNGARADGGDYSIDYAAADPDIYIPAIPYPATVTPIVGRGNGDAQIPSAWHSDPSTKVDLSVESLSPKDMALCQVVPFEILITVTGTPDPGDMPLNFVAGWNIDTTNNSDFGYDEAYGVLAAFVDTGDGGTVDPNLNATVSSYSWAVVGDEIQGTFNVTGLETGEEVVVEVWLILDCTLPATVGGNVQSRLISAKTSGTNPKTATISTGNQTVPLLQAGSFTSVSVDIGVTKSDGDFPVEQLGTFNYTIPVTNYSITSVANTVIVTDVLDVNIAPNITDCNDPNTPAIEICAMIVQPSTRYCTWVDNATLDGYGGTITCYLDALAPLEVVTITIPVKVSGLTPTRGTIESGTCTQNPNLQNGQPVDVCNLVSVTTISNDTNQANNADSEPKDADKSTAVELLSFTATSQVRAVLLKWTTATEVNNAGFNLYRSTSVKGKRVKLNSQIIPAVPGSIDGADYQYLDGGLQAQRFYFYWLEAVDLNGTTQVFGPIRARSLAKTFRFK